MKRISPVLAAVLLVAMPACHSGDDDPVSIAGTVPLRISLTDTPLDLTEVESVFVTIDEVSVYPSMLADGSDPGPLRMMTAPVQFDLLTLTDGAREKLAEADLPAGLYSRIRLGVPEAELLFLDGTRVPLKIESHKVDIPIAFELNPDPDAALNEVLLDFQADASVHVVETGSESYILRPVVTPVPL